jgi:hypothetical protein
MTAAVVKIVKRIKVRFALGREKVFLVPFDATPAGPAAPAAFLILICALP